MLLNEIDFAEEIWSRLKDAQPEHDPGDIVFYHHGGDDGHSILEPGVVLGVTSEGPPDLGGYSKYLVKTRDGDIVSLFSGQLYTLNDLSALYGGLRTEFDKRCETEEAALREFCANVSTELLRKRAEGDSE